MVERRVIIVDLDNVVYDWVHAMATWLDKNDALNRMPKAYNGNGGLYTDMVLHSLYAGSNVSRAMQLYSQWSIWDDWNIPKGEFMRWWRLGIEAGEIYAKGRLIPGARDALWKLSDAEWSIFIASSRLSKFGAYDKIVANTAQWLNENNIPYRDLAITSLKTRIIADAIVDDRLDNMSPLVHAKRYLFEAPHNRGDEARHWTWPEIVEDLLAEATVA